MIEASSFAEEIRAVSGELRLEPLAPVRLNHAATRIDRLGRRLHGMGWVRDDEIGACLTSAVAELSLARGQPESERAASVERALLQLEAALAHTNGGMKPRHP